jgi:hypothetical protein
MVNSLVCEVKKRQKVTREELTFWCNDAAGERREPAGLHRERKRSHAVRAHVSLRRNPFVSCIMVVT